MSQLEFACSRLRSFSTTLELVSHVTNWWCIDLADIGVVTFFNFSSGVLLSSGGPCPRLLLALFRLLLLLLLLLTPEEDCWGESRDKLRSLPLLSLPERLLSVPIT